MEVMKLAENICARSQGMSRMTFQPAASPWEAHRASADEGVPYKQREIQKRTEIIVPVPHVARDRQRSRGGAVRGRHSASSKERGAWTLKN